MQDSMLPYTWVRHATSAASICMQVPTTVMATVDSSVGGKTGVNHPLGKNMIGAFYQPQCVLIDTDTLITLPDRELASGISEIVKYGLIRDAPLFEWLEENMDRLMQRDPEVLLLKTNEKTAPFGVSFMRSQALYRAAQYCLLLLYHKCGT